VVRAGDNPDIKPLLDKAVKAVGGPDRATKLKNVTWKGNGSFTFGQTKTNGSK